MELIENEEIDSDSSITENTASYDNSVLSYDSDDAMVGLNERQPSTSGKHRFQDKNSDTSNQKRKK